MTNGEQCVMMAGAVLMLLLSASSWVMQLLEVSTIIVQFVSKQQIRCFFFFWVTGGIPYSNAFFGAGTGPIYLDDVACTSSDSQLLECSSRPILRHNCPHSTDAGVGCEGNIFLISAMRNVCCNNWLMLLTIIFIMCSSMQNWSTSISWRQHSK